MTEAVWVSLIAAALLAGAAGTWSPCGFSMIETIGPRGHSGGSPTTAAACVTFTLGALAGGVATFGSMALAGGVVHGSAGTAAYLVAAVLAICAAVAELRGMRIMPQVRRQLPEHWRRLMPMPAAAGLYGVLLGLGFTTFVLSFGVFALAGITFAVGDAVLGVAVGLAFGLGRALPVVFTAPFADRTAGRRVTDAMAQRPAIYRGFRAGDGVALLASAAALAVAVPAGAAKNAARPATDPSVAGNSLVYEGRDGSGVIRRDGRRTALPGHDPAIGDGRVAVIRQGRIVLLSAADLGELGSFGAKAADAVAVSRHWVVWRVHLHGRDYMRARQVVDPRRAGPVRSLGRSGRQAQLGHPSLDDNRVVYTRAGPQENVIVKQVLGGKRARRSRLMRSSIDALQNPTILGNDLLYVRITGRTSRLMLARVGGGHGRTLFRTRSATLWSTALRPTRAYVTVLHGATPRARIISVNR